MRRLVLAAVLTFLSVLAVADNALTVAAQKRLDKAAKTGGEVTLYAGLYDAPLVLRPIEGQPFVSGVHIKAPGPFSRLKKGHDGPFLVTEEAKDCTFQLPILGFGKGTGVEVRAKSSSSRLRFEGCHFQGLETGISFLAEGGADISVTNLTMCEFNTCGVGVKYVGSNNLDPVLFQSTFSNCGIGMDFREGGSNFEAIACGGSYCKEFAVVRAGWQGRLGVTSFEGSGTETFLRIGGDSDAGGSGAETNVSVSANDVRTVATFAVLNCSGNVSLMAHKAAGSILVRNKSSNPLTARVSPAVDKLKTLVAEGTFSKVQ